MIYCPLIREKCRGIECAFWLNEIPEEGNKCAIYLIGLSFRAGLRESFFSPPELKACNEKVLQELRGKPIEEIAEEILEFMKKNYPEALNSGYIPPEVFDYFWADKGIPPDILPFENPELYLTKIKVESIAKLGLKRILEKQKGIANEVKVISHVENVHPSEGALRELKEKSPEEIAEEIIQFIEKEFPEAIELGGGLHEAKTFFWMKKGLRAGCVEDPEINLKIRRAELLAEKKIKLRISGKEEITGKIPEEINNKSEEELANELVVFVRKEFPDDPSSSIRYLGRISDFFWRQKGVEKYQVDHAIRHKITKVEDLALKKLEREIQELEKERLSKLVDECFLWAKKHGLKKVTKSNIYHFLTEKGAKLSTMNIDALYSQVNLKLQSEKYQGFTLKIENKKG